MSTSLRNYSTPLQKSIIEGMFASIMTGGGMAFLVAYAVFLGANSMDIAYLMAIPALFSAWIQISSMKILSVYGQRKIVVVLSTFFQSISWLLIALIPLIFPHSQVFWLIVLTTIGITIGSLGTPLWQSWMRSLTPKEILGEYFGVRNALTGMVVFITIITCGALLQIIEPSHTLFAFILIFLLSFFGRMMSTIVFTQIYEPKMTIKEEKLDLMGFVKQLGKDEFGTFIIFGTMMSLTLAMIGPFFSFYLLNTLGLSTNYFLYTIIISATMLSTVVSLPYWGKIIDHFGVIKVLKATTLLLAIYPLLLIMVRDPILLIPIEIFDGIIIAGFSLGLASFIYGAFDTDKIIRYATYQSILFGTATFIGTLIAGYMLLYSVSWTILSNTFYIICALVVGLRIGIYALSIHKIKEVEKKEPIRSQKLVISALTLQPITEPLITKLTPIISTTENVAIKEVKFIEDMAVKEIELVEEKAINDIKKIKELAEKEVKRINGKQKNNKKLK